MFFCFCDNNCKYETMTKEQIITAIYQACKEGHISNIDTGFITKVKETNKGEDVVFWVGTTAEYNALSTKDPKCFYLKTDDTTLSNFATEIEEIKKYVDTTLGAFGAELNKTRIYGDLERIVMSTIPLYGYITSEGAALVFFLPLSKPISDTINDFVFNKFEFYIAGVNGLIGGGKIDARTIDYFVSTAKYENGLKFSVQSLNGAFSNAVNATPVVVNATIDILFTNSNAMNASEGAE